MHIVLLQSKLDENAIRQLIDEFPQFLFLAPTERSYRQLGNEEWQRIEIIYGNHLSAEDLAKAHQLHWIHSPSHHLNPLCLEEIEKRGNIILTTVKEENVVQIGEYVLAGILAYAKQLFLWNDADKKPEMLLDSKLRDTMWKLQGRLLLQIGLGDIGSEITRVCKMAGMEVWAVQEKPSFHPDCRKVIGIEELHAALPEADVVSIALPRKKKLDKKWLGEKEFNLMKPGSILVIIGSREAIDEVALVEVAKKNKFRGILLDEVYQTHISSSSKLWSLPNILITPEAAPRPKSEEKEPFKTFRYNFRQYIHGNFSDMKGIISWK